MPASRRAITSRVTVQNPRPRKYASAAEKQAAFRARFPTLCVRVEPKTADTVQAVADASGRTQQETLLSMLKYAMTNRNWLTLGLTEHKQLPRIEEPRKENPMKRKPTPAQIAARERFAAMARSGAFKKKAAKAKAKPKRNPIERYELRRLDKTNALDSTYKTLTHAKSALDEIDRPPASFYVIDTETGKPHFSFQAQTKFPGIEIRGTAMQKAYKRNPRAANPQARSIKHKGARNIAYAVEAKRMLAGGGSQFEMIAGFPTKAQAQDYIDALLKSYPKGLTLRISAA